jgi:membrane-associated phospholipid phosphatase
MATVLGDYKPQYKWFAYGIATTIGWSRVKLEAHHWWDVVAGAGLGYAVGKHYTRQSILVGSDGVSVNWKF